MCKLPEPLTLVIANDVRELRRMSAWFEASSRSLGVPERSREDLEVCANEAVTNVIAHGWDSSGEHSIALRLERLGSDIALEIVDEGRPFDPLAGPSQAISLDLESAPVGGLGLPLIRGLLPRSRYARIQGRNVLTLVASGAP